MSFVNLEAEGRGKPFEDSILVLRFQKLECVATSVKCPNENLVWKWIVFEPYTIKIQTDSQIPLGQKPNQTTHTKNSLKIKSTVINPFILLK